MTAAPKLYNVLHHAATTLEANGREPKVAELLLQHYLGVSRTAFLTMMRDPVPDAVLQDFRSALKAHVQTGVPLEHLTGYASFYGRHFRVNNDTLIPRPETEELVQLAIETASSRPLTIADIGTGSGNIAVTLALALPNAAVYATDISEAALNVARYNATQMAADVTFYKGHYGEPLIDRGIYTDILIANPPYIASSDKRHLSETVRDFEPAEALFAGEDGLDAYQTMISQLPSIIKADGYGIWEIGHEQATAVQALVRSVFPNSQVAVHQDMNGQDRLVKAGPLQNHLYNQATP